MVTKLGKLDDIEKIYNTLEKGLVLISAAPAKANPKQPQANPDPNEYSVRLALYVEDNIFCTEENMKIDNIEEFYSNWSTKLNAISVSQLYFDNY